MGATLGGHALSRSLNAWASAAVLRTIPDASPLAAMPMVLDERALFSLNESILLVALILFALAEIFKRGASLEHEQSLVV